MFLKILNLANFVINQIKLKKQPRGYYLQLLHLILILCKHNNIVHTHVFKKLGRVSTAKGHLCFENAIVSERIYFF